MVQGQRVFLSAVTGQFLACREALASDLRAIGCEVRVQEDFQQGPRTLLEKLEAYIAECDRVIALVGDTYGWEADGEVVPANAPPRSYTQWEHRFAIGERLDGTPAPRKNLYLYFASATYLANNPAPADQRPEHTERQRAFVTELRKSGKDFGEFNGVEELCRRVLRDGWQIERPSAHCPSNLPYQSLGSLFKGRVEFLREVRLSLEKKAQLRPESVAPAGAQATAIVSTQAIHGLGGIGKTRAAVEYAWANEHAYSALLYVPANSPAALDASLAALCGAQTLDLPEKEIKEQDVQVAAAVRWLREHPGWLLILDNADSDQAAEAVRQLLGVIPGGHVLITSRRGVWPGEVDALELKALSPEASKAYLLDSTEGRRQVRESDEADVATLVTHLGGLALALEQAAAHIVAQRLSFAEYLSRWKAGAAKVREWPKGALRHYPESVATTWLVTFDSLSPPARALLNTLAWLAPDPLPRDVLGTPEAKTAFAALDAKSADGAPDPEEALGELALYSLVAWEEEGRACSVHRLVQEVTRDRLAPEEQRLHCALALLLVNAYLPSEPPPTDVRSWPRWDPMRTHAQTLLEHPQALSAGDPAVRLMHGLGSYFDARARWGEAEPLMRRALAIDEAAYGQDHPNVAIRLNNLAQLLQATNRLKDAEPLMRRAIAIDEAAYGQDHPNVAIRLNNLAQLLQATNRLKDAEPLMRRVVEIFEKSYGDTHPNVATALNNLAQLLQATNRLKDAEPLMRRVVEIFEKSYGDTHPSVAIALNNLAQLLQATNRLKDAEPLMRRHLEIFLKFTAATGHPHPHLEAAFWNYAALLSAMGLNEAQVLERLNDLAKPYGMGQIM